MNKITIKRISWVMIWMALAWFAFPSKCSSESCAYGAIFGGISSFIFLVISSILILSFWSKIFSFENKYNLKPIDTYGCIVVTLANILLWIYFSIV